MDELRVKFPSLYPFVTQCYGDPSVLKFGCGVQQGDPLGPFLFCLAIHPLLLKIRAECPSLVSNSWYLDDGVVAGSEADVTRALHIIESEGPGRGMFLNTAKSEVWNPQGAVPASLKHFKALEAEGFELLGSPIGRRLLPALLCQEDDQVPRSLGQHQQARPLADASTAATLLRLVLQGGAPVSISAATHDL